MTCPQIERARSSHPRIAIHKQSCRDSGHKDVPHHKRLPGTNDQRTRRLARGILTTAGHRDSLCRCRGTLVCWAAFRGWEQ